MPRKKKRKEKTREYLETLLKKAGLKDKDLAEAIARGIKSDNTMERTKALEIASEWMGFKDAIEKQSETLEILPIGNISKENLEKLSNRCADCKHTFESKFSNKQLENNFIKENESNVNNEVDNEEFPQSENQSEVQSEGLTPKTSENDKVDNEQI